jgi:hypothetical protein
MVVFKSMVLYGFQVDRTKYMAVVPSGFGVV